MTTLSHKGYLAEVTFDPEDDVLTGHLAGIRDKLGFQAGDVGGLQAAFHDAVDDDLATCSSIGKAPECSADVAVGHSA